MQNNNIYSKLLYKSSCTLSTTVELLVVLWPQWPQWPRAYIMASWLPARPLWYERAICLYAVGADDDDQNSIHWYTI